MENARHEHEQGGVMRRGFRAALLAAVGAAAALGWSSSALAAYTPQFIVNHNPHNVASATTSIRLGGPREDRSLKHL
jgi:hypothetical protein